MIMGMHNYFQIATCVSSDFADMGREVDVVKLSQLKRKALSTKGDYKGFSFIEKKYGKANKSVFTAESLWFLWDISSTRIPCGRKIGV